MARPAKLACIRGRKSWRISVARSQAEIWIWIFVLNREVEIIISNHYTTVRCVFSGCDKYRNRNFCGWTLKNMEKRTKTTLGYVVISIIYTIVINNNRITGQLTQNQGDSCDSSENLTNCEMNTRLDAMNLMLEQLQQRITHLEQLKVSSPSKGNSWCVMCAPVAQLLILWTACPEVPGSSPEWVLIYDEARSIAHGFRTSIPSELHIGTRTAEHKP